MKKTRINLAEQFPNYFATANPGDAFAELADEDVSRLGVIENALAKIPVLEATIETLEHEREIALAAAPGAIASAEAEIEERIDAKMKALTDQIAELKGILENKPAADATSFGQGDGQEGGGQASAKKVKSSVEQELDRLNGIK
jgi:hypothetical protein